MYSTDFDSFAGLLKGLGEVFSKPVSDSLASSYWSALKDLPLAQVKSQVEHHTRYGKYFPKPIELRPRDEAQPSKSDAGFEARKAEIDRENFFRLESLRARDPVEWRRQVTPQVTEVGLKKGLTHAQIEAKIERYMREGPR